MTVKEGYSPSDFASGEWLAVDRSHGNKKQGGVRRPWGGKQCIFLRSSDGKESVHNVGDPGLIPGSGRSPGVGNGNPL